MIHGLLNNYYNLTTMKKFLLVVMLCAFCSCQQSSIDKNSSETQKLEELVLAVKDCFDTPGLAVGVIKNGKLFYKGAHGVRDLDGNNPLTTQSIFHMASVSKPFVATCVVQLVEQGKIDLDEKLTHYLPYFTMADERYKDITIRHMLVHTSGIPNVKDYEWDQPQYDDGAAERYARWHASLKLDFTPGEKQSYSNAAFDILVDVIAKASGMAFEDYVEQNIFRPVGMVNSTFYYPEVTADIATKGHVLGDSLEIVVSDVYPYNRRHAGSSTLNSNIDDMLLWAEVNLNKGIINGKRIYSEASYDLLTGSQWKFSDTSYGGLSWFVSKFNGDTKIAHSDGDTGFRSYFAFIPEKQSAIVLMANVNPFWSSDVSNVILKNTIYKDTIEWKIPISHKLRKHILTDGIEKVKNIYQKERDNTSSVYVVESGLLDDLGYELLDRGHLNQALEIFMYNTELEPNHAGWVDSVADAYRAMDSTEVAIKWYEKAIKMKPDQKFSIRKLNELLGK
jgi:CubicO group peptidase (beta-lactamase class C family)